MQNHKSNLATGMPDMRTYLPHKNGGKSYVKRHTVTSVQAVGQASLSWDRLLCFGPHASPSTEEPPACNKS